MARTIWARVRALPSTGLAAAVGGVACGLLLLQMLIIVAMALAG